MEVFKLEDSTRSYLVERLLQLAFLIRINNVDFDSDLTELLKDFKYKLGTYNICIPKQWEKVIDSQIKSQHSIHNCTLFVDMMHSAGEPYCIIKRYFMQICIFWVLIFLYRHNTIKDVSWASFLPTLIVVSENQPLTFSEARNIFFFFCFLFFVFCFLFFVFCFLFFVFCFFVFCFFVFC
jgi:hypothetical protein